MDGRPADALTRRLRARRSWRSGLVFALVACAALATAPTASASSASRDAYRGLAAWIDMFDARPWDEPERTIGDLARREVTTVFVQTSNYRHRHDIHRRAALARLLAAAHAEGMAVVGWYLPGFTDPRRDWRRVEAAVSHVSELGDRFDGFALDIEATAVKSIAVRNRRLLALAGRLRSLVGSDYALGAIVPDPVTQRYWPRFPWRQVGERFDAVLPMSYWTAAVSGEARAYRHTRAALRALRTVIPDPAKPLHPIGGIASDASVREVRGFARAAIESGAAGASLYDAPITRPAQWRRLQPIALLRLAASPAAAQASGFPPVTPRISPDT